MNEYYFEKDMRKRVIRAVYDSINNHEFVEYDTLSKLLDDMNLDRYYRVTSRDGRGSITGCDSRSDRLNLTVKNGFITKARIG